MDERISALLRTRVAVVGELSEASIRLLDSTVRPVHLRADAALLHPGDPCGFATVVLDGTVRVHTTSRSGRDLTLYRVGPGGMCALSALCVQTAQPFPAYADATDPTIGIAVPQRTFRALLDSEPAWRGYVFGAMWNRVDSLIERIDDVAFSALPDRLARMLIERNVDGVVDLTHERLAAEVGSSREVVSRMLGRWERAGIVALGRGRITIVSRAGLDDVLRT